MKHFCTYCNKPVKAKGLCQFHYNRARRGGDPLSLKGIPGPKSEINKSLDPHIQWILKEAKIQGFSGTALSEKAGYHTHMLTDIRKYGNIRFLTFKAFVNALGYEIALVAKEPTECGPDQTPKSQASRPKPQANHAPTNQTLPNLQWPQSTASRPSIENS